MSNIIREHILNALVKGQRLDGRKFNEYRNIVVEPSISPKSAEGSAKVTLGGTEVVAGVKFEIGTPFPDKPDEGSIMVNMELLPLASPEFESGPPDIKSIELARVVDRVIRESHVIDFKKLCITEGEKVWMICIDVYPLNDNGNLFDAAALAAMAALMDAKFPKMEEDKVLYGELTNKKVITTVVPTSCTVIKIGNHLIVDPSLEEEKFYDARITFGVTEDLSICALQKGGDKALKLEEIDQMAEMAIAKSPELRKVLENGVH